MRNSFLRPQKEVEKNEQNENSMRAQVFRFSHSRSLIYADNSKLL